VNVPASVAARLLIGLVSSSLALSACGGGATHAIATLASPTQQPTSPTPSVLITHSPATPSPTTLVTPEPEGKVVKVQEVVLAWKPYSGSIYVDYQVIAELKNVGTGWAQVSGFDSDYTILDQAGGVTATGSFTYEFPEFVGSGQTGYLIDDSSQDGVKIADFHSVEVDGRYDAVDAPDQILKVTGIKWHRDSYDGTLTATGFVTSSVDLDSAAVAVVCLSSNGTILGATWTNLLQNITAGKPKGFETVAGTPPHRISDCAKAVGFAESTT
jgi:hypothetical protein